MVYAQYTWLLGLTVPVAFISAFGIGANVRNSPPDYSFACTVFEILLCSASKQVFHVKAAALAFLQQVSYQLNCAQTQQACRENPGAGQLPVHLFARCWQSRRLCSCGLVAVVPFVLASDQALSCLPGSIALCGGLIFFWQLACTRLGFCRAGCCKLVRFQRRLQGSDNGTSDMYCWSVRVSRSSAPGRVRHRSVCRCCKGIHALLAPGWCLNLYNTLRQPYHDITGKDDTQIRSKTPSQRLQHTKILQVTALQTFASHEVKPSVNDVIVGCCKTHLSSLCNKFLSI